MAKILSFETSTFICSVAIHDNGVLLASTTLQVEKSHAEYITQLAAQVLSNTKIKIEDIDAFAVSSGPGSYTGLRIGASTCKGFCYALDKPMIAINTLEAMALSVKVPNYLSCPMLDARRMEVYCAIYNMEGIEILPTQAKLIDQESFSEYNNIIFFGNGAAKCENMLNVANGVFIHTIQPSAENIGKLAYKKYVNSNYADVSNFEPDYLKEYLIKSK